MFPLQRLEELENQMLERNQEIEAARQQEMDQIDVEKYKLQELEEQVSTLAFHSPVASLLPLFLSSLHFLHPLSPSPSSAPAFPLLPCFFLSLPLPSSSWAMLA